MQLLQSLNCGSEDVNTQSVDNSEPYPLKDLRRPAALHFPLVTIFERPKKFQFKVVVISYCMYSYEHFYVCSQCVSILTGNTLLSPVMLEEAIGAQGKTKFLVTITFHNGRLKIERINRGKPVRKTLLHSRQLHSVCFI